MIISFFISFVLVFRVEMVSATTRYGHAWQSWRRTSNLPKVFSWSRFVYHFSTLT